MFLKSLAGAFAVLALAAACGPSGRASIVSVEGDAFMGPADAKVTIIEYGSPTCPACKSWHDTFWEEVKRDYITPGKIRFVFREFAIHGAIDAGIFTIARCAGKDDFFKVLDEAFASQNEIVGAASRGQAIPELEKLGAKFNFSPEQVKTCMNDKANVGRINDVSADAHGKGINSTPTFVVNDIVIADSHWNAIKAAVDAALAGQPITQTAPAPEEAHAHVPGETH